MVFLSLMKNFKLLTNKRGKSCLAVYALIFVDAQMLYLQIFIVRLRLFLHLNNVITQVFYQFVEEFGYTSSTIFFMGERGRPFRIFGTKNLYCKLH
jgi:hypothetical protein